MVATVQVTCANKRCKVTFTARVADRKRGWGKFCSKSCKAVEQEKRTGQHARFLDRCDGYSKSMSMHEEAMHACEEGWDGHKVWNA